MNLDETVEKLIEISRDFSSESNLEIQKWANLENDRAKKHLDNATFYTKMHDKLFDLVIEVKKHVQKSNL